MRSSHASSLAAAAAATTACALALAGGEAGASGSGFITVRANDVVTVAGTSLRCLVQPVGYVCFPATAQGRPRAGTFAVSLVAPGLASISRVGRDLGLEPVVTKAAAGAGFRRRAVQQARSAARTVRIAVGQVVRLRVAKVPSALDCAVVRSDGRPTLYCAFDDATGPVPGSFAVLLSEREAAIGRVEASRTTTVTNLRRQPAR